MLDSVHQHIAAQVEHRPAFPFCPQHGPDRPHGIQPRHVVHVGEHLAGSQGRDRRIELDRVLIDGKTLPHFAQKSHIRAEGQRSENGNVPVGTFKGVEDDLPVTRSSPCVARITAGGA